MIDSNDQLNAQGLNGQSRDWKKGMGYPNTALVSGSTERRIKSVMLKRKTTQIVSIMMELHGLKVWMGSPEI